jgi:hypothetical protein
MGLDQSKAGQHMAEQMEAIEADYGNREGQWEIGDICTIVEVRGPAGAEVRMRSSATSPHSTLGLLKFAEIFAISQVTRGGGNE